MPIRLSGGRNPGTSKGDRFLLCSRKKESDSLGWKAALQGGLRPSFSLKEREKQRRSPAFVCGEAGTVTGQDEEASHALGLLPIAPVMN